MTKPPVLITCEHGGHRVPAAYRALFRSRQRWLESHEGYDRGALALARFLARRLRAPFYAAEVTRLLVDLNRSLPRNLFSRVTRELSPAERERILRAHYEPYRRRVETAITRKAASGVVHVAVHTFTPVRRGVRRTADIGLLYDPRRPGERLFCRLWQRALEEALPGWRVRRNDPYRGRDDGLTTALRKRLPPERYLGIEFELNQRHTRKPVSARHRIYRAVEGSFRSAWHEAERGWQESPGRRVPGPGPRNVCRTS